MAFLAARVAKRDRTTTSELGSGGLAVACGRCANYGRGSASGSEYFTFDRSNNRYFNLDLGDKNGDNY
jgi:hypothetical protein